MSSTKSSFSAPAVVGPCISCGALDVEWTKRYIEYSDRCTSFALSKCGACEIVYLNPQPALEELAARSGHYQQMMRDMLVQLERSPVGRLGMRIMKNSRTPRAPLCGRILDIGCSNGIYLARLRQLGWDVYGIEFDDEAAAQARRLLGGVVPTGTAERVLPTFEASTFDVVSMWHVLEHVSNPALVLKEVHRILKPGGTLLLEMPNFRSIYRRLLGSSWFPLEYPYHLFHFTPASLRRVLERSGFKTCGIECQAAPAETIWSFHML